MNFHILTLFPDMVMQGLSTSIIGRAKDRGLLSIEAVNIRDYTLERHKKVDDYPYGGGAGMLMQAPPVYDAWKSVVDRIGYKPRTVYLTPQGPTFTQPMAKDLAQEKDLILLCGHYEGIDERVLEEIVTDYVSIGDYVLTGGELPAMVMIDAISRLIPGVLHNDVSAEFRITFWSIHNIQDRRSGTVRRCRRYCFPGIMQMWRSGEESSRLSELRSCGRICWRRRS